MRRDTPTQSKKVEITFKNRKGTTLFTEEIGLNETIHNLKRIVWANTSIGMERQYITLETEGGSKSVPLKERHKTLTDYSITGASVLVVKDLGAQISWKTVFIVEYAGPIIMFILCFFTALAQKHSFQLAQRAGFALMLLHFIKREVETQFIHIFSNDTMPFKRIFINSFHYWILCGLFIGVELFFFWQDPGYSSNTVFILSGLVVLFEFLNLMAHITLRNLRTKGGYASEDNKGDFSAELDAQRSQRGIPKGWGFDLVSSANYFWEICIWLTFSILVRCWASYFFLLVSAAQMSQWALQKHSRYRKEFTGENGSAKFPRSRKAIIPFIL